MGDIGLTLQDLADRSGIEARTIRSWIQQGLVPGPDLYGRNARYPADTLTRLLAVKTLRDLYGLSLQAIRQELLLADARKIKEYAEQRIPAGKERFFTSASNDLARSANRGTAQPVDRAGKAPPQGSTAADYLRALRDAGVYRDRGRGRAASHDSSSRPARGKDAAPDLNPQIPGEADRLSGRGAPDPGEVAGVQGQSRIAQLTSLLESLSGHRFVPRRAKGEVRLRIPITPDIELSIRGHMAPEDIAHFERVADLLRELLIGGGPDAGEI